MTELEQALVALGGGLFPPQPNLVPPLGARLARRRVPVHPSAPVAPPRPGDQVSIVKKLAGPGTRMEGADLGEFGLWLEGGPHLLRWNFGSGPERQIQTRLAGNVLIWLQAGRTYRLEGDLDKTQMQNLGREITR